VLWFCVMAVKGKYRVELGWISSVDNFFSVSVLRFKRMEVGKVRFLLAD
jgi:hypothetical protein